MGWETGETVELTIGTVTYTKTTSPVRVDYSTTYNYNSVFKDGVPTVKLTLHDIVTVYLNDEPIGTIELRIKAVGGPAVGYSGVVNGFGTGAFEGVHISAIDLGPPLPTRVGTITGWPGLPAPA
jgi:hypothetical protein